MKPPTTPGSSDPTASRTSRTASRRSTPSTPASGCATSCRRRRRRRPRRSRTRSWARSAAPSSRGTRIPRRRRSWPSATATSRTRRATCGATRSSTTSRRACFRPSGTSPGRSKAKIALRHIVAESYVGSATPGWDREQGTRREVCTTLHPAEDRAATISDDTTHRVRFNAPTTFIYDIFVNPKNPLPVGTCEDGIDDDEDGVVDDGCPGQAFSARKKAEGQGPEPQRGPLVDYFLDLQADLELEARPSSTTTRRTTSAACSTRDCRRGPTPHHRAHHPRQQDDHGHEADVQAPPPSASPRCSGPTTRRGRRTSRSGSRTSATGCATGVSSASGSPRRCSIRRHGATRKTRRAATAATRTPIPARTTMRARTARTTSAPWTRSTTRRPTSSTITCSRCWEHRRYVGEARGYLNELADEIDDWIGRRSTRCGGSRARSRRSSRRS